MKTILTEYGVGGFDTSKPNNNGTSVTRIVAGLGSDRPTIPANGTTFAALNYAGPEPSPHIWTVNGAVNPPGGVVAVLDAASGLMWSELEITAAAAGPVEVAVGTATFTIQAV